MFDQRALSMHFRQDNSLINLGLLAAIGFYLHTPMLGDEHAPEPPVAPLVEHLIRPEHAMDQKVVNQIVNALATTTIELAQYGNKRSKSDLVKKFTAEIMQKNSELKSALEALQANNAKKNESRTADTTDGANADESPSAQPLNNTPASDEPFATKPLNANVVTAHALPVPPTSHVFELYSKSWLHRVITILDKEEEGTFEQSFLGMQIAKQIENEAMMEVLRHYGDESFRNLIQNQAQVADQHRQDAERLMSEIFSQ